LANINDDIEADMQEIAIEHRFSEEETAQMKAFIELVVRQMFSRVRVEDPGDSLYAAGEVISRASAIEENDVLTKEGKKPIVYSQLLLGLTRASIASDSFLSAASFQETTRVLVGAAITGKTDKLRGLKENVIIGRKIPVGTGARNKNGGLLSDDQ
jgi:DNA-directed RNA polymerase subunit beta'